LDELERDTQGYGGVAIDSLTTMQRAGMKFVHKLQPGIKRQLNFISNQNDYLVLMDIMSQLLPQLQSLTVKGMEVIVTSHIREFQSPLTAEIRNVPAIVGKTLPSQIGLWFNEVWRLFAEVRNDKVVHYAQTATADRYACKTQVKDMPIVLPVEEALQRVYDAYGTGNIMSAEEAQKKVEVEFTVAAQAVTEDAPY
jgi:hypothetical protein